jgi:hypothetical protein
MPIEKSIEATVRSNLGNLVGGEPLMDVDEETCTRFVLVARMGSAGADGCGQVDFVSGHARGPSGYRAGESDLVCGTGCEPDQVRVVANQAPIRRLLLLDGR